MLRSAFWDYPFQALRWETDTDLVVGRILAVGTWPMVRWLYRRLGDDALRTWLQERAGAGLSPKQLRFWQVILDIPKREVDAWLARPERRAWDGRLL